MEKELVKKEISYIGAGFRSISGYMILALILNLLYVYVLPQLGINGLEVSVIIMAVINVVLSFLVVKTIYMVGIAFEKINNQF